MSVWVGILCSKHQPSKPTCLRQDNVLGRRQLRRNPEHQGWVIMLYTKRLACAHWTNSGMGGLLESSNVGNVCLQGTMWRLEPFT